MAGGVPVKLDKDAMQIKKLEQERVQILQELEQLREAVKSEVDTNIGQGDPKLIERDMAISLILVQEQKLEAIDQALQEARRGMYGICERCGKPIDPDRLEVVPETTYCIKCKQIVERQGYR
jgi:DnaK suppressor protein